jgi:hypothetical protein
VGNGRRGRRRSRIGHDEFTGFEPMRHTMWTFEGQIEQISRFARRLNRSSGWRRRAGKTLFTLPLWVMLGSGVVMTIGAALRWVF